MRLHDARSGCYNIAIVLLAHILPVGQEDQCHSLGDQSTPIDRIEHPRHAVRGLYGVDIQALCTVHGGRTSRPGYRRGSISTGPC
jgi:hypothetical protein